VERQRSSGVTEEDFFTAPQNMRDARKTESHPYCERFYLDQV
jgi:hypothetical protein